MSKQIGRIIAVLAIFAAAAGQARADVSGTVWYDTSSAGNATIANMPTSGTSSTFTSTAINYGSPSGNNTIGSFLNSAPNDNPTPVPVTTFISNPGIAGDQLSFSNPYGAYVLLTGTVTVAAGTNNIVIKHDDGVQLALSGLGNVITAAGPTSEETSTATVGAGTYTFTLSYGETAGLPAILEFFVNGNIVTGVVPEPSTMAIAGLGAIGFIGYGLRRRKARTA
jgi:hypothetical protein